MGMKYTQIPTDTFEKMQMNAGILVDDFAPATGTIGNILGATTGGIHFTATPSFKDFGEDIDNCPKNTKELKKLDDWEVKASGSFVTVSPSLGQVLVGAADVSSNKITPRRTISPDDDFDDLWIVADYSDENGATNGGFVAIHMMNTLSTGGFQMQTTDKDKGKFAFEFMAHYSIEDQDTVPFEIYIQEGTPESGSYRMTVSSVAGSTTGKTAITTGETAGASQSYVYQTGYDLKVPSQGTVLAGTAWTAWDGDDEITAATGIEIVVAIIDGESKAVHAGKATVVAKGE